MPAPSIGRADTDRLSPQQIDQILQTAVCLWQEDDALAEGRESLAEALRRIWPTWTPQVLYHSQDEGDCLLEFELRKNPYGPYFLIMQKGVPGDSALFVAPAMDFDEHTETRLYAVGVKDEQGNLGMIAGPVPTLQEAKTYTGKGHVIVQLPGGQPLYRWKRSSEQWVAIAND